MCQVWKKSDNKSIVMLITMQERHTEMDTEKRERDIQRWTQREITDIGYVRQTTENTFTVGNVLQLFPLTL